MTRDRLTCRRNWVPKTACLASAILCLAVSTAPGANLYVNNFIGNDNNPGTEALPLATAKRALKDSRAGDTIYLLPPGALYREMLTFNNKTNVTIEGNGSTFSGADLVAATNWTEVGPDLHRMQIPRNIEDRYILVVNGLGNRMGRNKYARGDLETQFPPLEQLQPGDFRVEPIAGGQDAWLYVKGSISNLEWAVRTQGLDFGGGHVRDITLRNLNARHALNDGFGLHGDSQNIVLTNVQGYENYDNGVSPHGGCSMIVENGSFWGNGTPAWAQGDATETIYRRCAAAGDSGHQWEVVFAGGFHLVEDSIVHLNGNELWFVYWAPRGGAIDEILLAGKDPTVKPQFLVRNTLVLGDPVLKGTVVIGAEATLTLADCTFSNVVFDVDPGAVVRVSGGTSDGQPLLQAIPRAVPVTLEPQPPRIETATKSNNVMRIEFTPEVGTAYSVQYCHALGGGSWTTFTNISMQPVARKVVVSDTTANSLQRFYRVIIEPKMTTVN